MATPPTALRTLPPSRTASSHTTHLQTIESIQAQRISVATLDADAVIVDVLNNLAGESLTEPEYVLLSATTTTPTSVAAKGVYWVKEDTPSRLMFTDDASNTVALTPGLGDMLGVGDSADSQSIANVASLTFRSSVIIGTSRSNASASEDRSVVIGRVTASTASNTVVIGAFSSSSLQYSTVVGHLAVVTTASPDANAVGGVAVGSSIASVGRAICVGNTITNTNTNQDANNEAILLGQSITCTGTLGGSVCVGSSIAKSAPDSVIVGSSATAVGASPQTDMVCIGYSAQSGTHASIAIGPNAYCAVSADVDSAVGGGMAIGFQAKCTHAGGISFGYVSQCYGTNAISFGHAAQIGSGYTGAVALGHGASATTYSVAVGRSASSNGHASSVALGPLLQNREDFEVCTRGSRTLYATTTTPQDTPSTIVSFGTSAGETYHVEATVVGMRSDSLASYMTVFENYHFRNKGGTLTRAVGGTQHVDITDNSNGLVVTLVPSAQNIIVTVQGNVQQTWSWRCTLRIMAATLT